ncbi:hypothetical protein A3A76_04970 [Candidatus Woesebacteria bacterium RIFCSPLOWO2_01_FULL_39_23]|uniref:Uncharacterized protein n=2 Tax=Microgenomates group TaxID=1794810 RepID=A0A0H4TNN8_9BACT|nr:hypothetical protein [uncultured Microgenomates bacterium Rifle_16ft_4_minimus_37633]OGM13835.1 MAG: hypothetical protein A2141_04195 [Candidatus Woesebacteria bacterium RBG_16_40_11]OGM27785.1 MAG: hypothetical protein A2628_05190 [Candidatus Woesebacteria bacterium RIFCSPHIGHO2_01_FULL_40_22]OGM36202.1 MAG: hypothetical protein A3E41_00820 [Candidatus Woesebacteria bacterium RIFCSPHIGHO2_12_FULL_38_9]OGM62207.1 MAG: hypothetical protein A3A76_04970 [Candidatus Woesebacteria bacterium RIFCS
MKKQQIINLAKDLGRGHPGWESRVEEMADLANLSVTINPEISIKASDSLLKAARMEKIAQDLGLHERRRL